LALPLNARQISLPPSLKQRSDAKASGIPDLTSVVSERAPAGTVMGTPGFMTPEQSRDSATVTGKADVFAIATLFYLAVVGDMPWGSAGSAIAICLKQHTEPPIDPPATLMPAPIRNIVFRALSVQPEARPTMQKFAYALAAAIPAEHSPQRIHFLSHVPLENRFPIHLAALATRDVDARGADRCCSRFALRTREAVAPTHVLKIARASEVVGKHPLKRGQ
jgi:serine/threonine protein kinase